MKQQPIEITVTLPIEALNKTLMLLGSHPFNEVADIIVDMRNQAQEQIQKLQQPNLAERPQGGPPQLKNGEDHHASP
ncbi:MAG TPA: hypothetical protein VK741_22935 [Acetobacteraceae bacterium]|jgi:hypothetical protein|nr:hypothetical protein [Acetobacteraceae bacterium]